MYYHLSLYPEFSPLLADAIETIRKECDPLWPSFEPHITVIHPTPERVGKQPLIDHIQNVLTDFSPFDIHLGGLLKTPNHWLLLGVQEGGAEIKRLYRELHTGILDDGRNLDKFAPQIGLGLFVKPGTAHDWFNPRDEDFDCERYQMALPRAEALPLAEPVRLKRLLFGAVPDSVIDWVRGRLIHFPHDANEGVIQEFCLRAQTA